jgi:MSHA biogenesis protein MshL
LGDLPIVGKLFQNISRNIIKSELVILIKPTVITGDESWDQDMLDTQLRLQNFETPLHPTIEPSPPPPKK